MSLRNPTNVGSDPDQDPPETLLEMTVTIEHRRDLSPERMREVADTVADRLEAAVQESNFADLPLAGISTDVSWPASRTSPLYPLRVGDDVFTCRMDVVERLERLAHDAGLGRTVVDLDGRRYDIHVDVSFQLVAGESGSPAPRATAGVGG
jgi:hypothetical protein